MAEGKARILVVDDEQDIVDILNFNLKTAGYDVTEANSAEEALDKIKSSGDKLFDLVLLDVMMGGMSGFEMAQLLKSDPHTSDIPVVFLTAKGTQNDTITGLNIGADDYISKPFSLQEVLLRIKAILRRTSGTATSVNSPEVDNITFQTLSINQNRKTVEVDGIDIPFTKTEYELLRLLVMQKGRVLSRQDLIDKAWPDDVMVSDRTVDVNITRIRKKIGRYADNIVTRLGFGYVFEG